jgi:uncharacterized protein
MEEKAKWIVMGENGKGDIGLVSKSTVTGILPEGSYLTVLGHDGDGKYVLRVQGTSQTEPYSPTPLVVDMDLTPLIQDQRTQNVVSAKRIKDLTSRDDGLIDFIKPQSIARRSNQTEIDLAMDSSASGPEIMLATVHSTQNSVLRDDDNRPITAKLPEDMFYHQIMICGKTGSGKTVASKYLVQWFIEKLQGAALVVNVKDVDFLQMDRPSEIKNESALAEWSLLGLDAEGIENTTIYYPANANPDTFRGVNKDICERVCLKASEIDPDSLTGLIRGISDVGAQNLPGIFRYWQSKFGLKKNLKFSDFVTYFAEKRDDRLFDTMGDSEFSEREIMLHSATYNNVLRCLSQAEVFFDQPNARFIDSKDILQPGKLSVINVATGKNGVDFGSTLLRHLLHKIVEAKSQQVSKVPILIVIDEVHQFYNAESSKDALGDLDTICRTGRSQEIGVIFSSQNPQDLPSGLGSVINTKILFKSDYGASRGMGGFSNDDVENLKKGFAAVSIHNMSQIKFVKFPIARAGVFEK